LTRRGTRPRPSPDGDSGTDFGYLGVRIRGTDVWTTGRDSTIRCLGPLAGARAGLSEPRRSRIGAAVSRVLLADMPPKNARLFVAFADGTRYERLPLPWVRGDWPKIAGEIGRFNAVAVLASES